MTCRRHVLRMCRPHGRRLQHRMYQFTLLPVRYDYITYWVTALLGCNTVCSRARQAHTSLHEIARYRVRHLLLHIRSLWGDSERGVRADLVGRLCVCAHLSVCICYQLRYDYITYCVTALLGRKSLCLRACFSSKCCIFNTNTACTGTTTNFSTPCILSRNGILQ